MNKTTQKEKGCFNCGADLDHFIISHGQDVYTCEAPQEMDSEEYGVIMGWVN